MSDRGSGSGGHRRSDRLAKGKAVAYAPESSPDTDDERSFDAEAAGLASSAAIRPPPRPGVVIGRSARPSETTRPSPQPGVTTGPSDAPSAAPRRPHTRSTGIPPSRLKRQRTEGIPDSAGTIPEDYVAPGFRYPPHGGIRPRYPVAVEISDTPLLTNLLAHPSSLVRRCQEPPDSAGRGGWSDFCRLLGGFPSRIGALSLGIRFGGRAPPSEPIDGFEAREILGLADRDAIEGVRRPSVRIRHLADVLRRDREEPPTELRYRQWAAYFIFSCFLGNDRSIVPTPIVGMFRDIDTLREYDWGALTYGFYIRALISAALSQRPEVFRAVAVVSSEAVDPDLSVLGASAGSGSSRVSLGSLMSLHEVARVAVSWVGVAMDSHLIRSSGQIERLQSEILRLQLELSVSVDRHTADMDPSTGRDGQYADGVDPDAGGDDTAVGGLGPEPEGLWIPGMQRWLVLAAAIRRLEEQLQGM
uniref:Aminotransferase-like plant mobile domain-containing protein n=1 Tax=Fagus sylvatica TaxID=28930 RepID=A0A2N9ISX8_FAGSY